MPYLNFNEIRSFTLIFLKIKINTFLVTLSSFNICTSYPWAGLGELALYAIVWFILNAEREQLNEQHQIYGSLNP